jgi:hypothetical protein
VCAYAKNGNVIPYSSCQSKTYEQNYPMNNLEVAAIVYALMIWRHYFYGEKCKNYTDQKSLKYFFTQKKLNMGSRMLLEQIKSYDYEINYHPGKANVVVNVLSMKSMVELAALEIFQPQLIKEFAKMRLEVVGKGALAHLTNLMV